MSKKILKKALKITIAISLFAMMFFLVSDKPVGTIIGFLIGCVVVAVCFYLMWCTVQNPQRAWFFYVLRVSIMFGSVITSMFISAINSLGVVLPLIFSIPVLVITVASNKKGD